MQCHTSIHLLSPPFFASFLHISRKKVTERVGGGRWRGTGRDKEREEKERGDREGGGLISAR